MRQLFYSLAQHDVTLRALIVLVVMVAIAVAIGAPEPVAAGPDCFGP